ncbi:hypothetical protein OLL98_00005 (plasmid) [Enterococcus faecalis]|nr:hypothetical protein OLL98_00005 [Enterococcus faecalis]
MSTPRKPMANISPGGFFYFLNATSLTWLTTLNLAPKYGRASCLPPIFYPTAIVPVKDQEDGN